MKTEEEGMLPTGRGKVWVREASWMRCNCNPHLTARESLAASKKTKWVERIGGPNDEPA